MKYEARIEGERTSPADPYDSWGRSVIVEADSFLQAVERVFKEAEVSEFVRSVTAIDV